MLTLVIWVDGHLPSSGPSLNGTRVRNGSQHKRGYCRNYQHVVWSAVVGEVEELAVRIIIYVSGL